MREQNAGGMPDARIGDREFDIPSIARPSITRLPPSGHCVPGVANQISKRDPKLFAVPERMGQTGGTTDRHLDPVARRVQIQRVANNDFTSKGCRFGTGTLAKLDSDVITSSASSTLRSIRFRWSTFSRGSALRALARVVRRGLDHVERVSELVGNAAGDLSQGRQALMRLQASHVFGLICVFDDRQVEIQ